LLVFALIVVTNEYEGIAHALPFQTAPQEQEGVADEFPSTSAPVELDEFGSFTSPDTEPELPTGKFHITDALLVSALMPATWTYEVTRLFPFAEATAMRSVDHTVRFLGS